MIKEQNNQEMTSDIELGGIARVKNLRISPRKLNLVAKAVRNRSILDAQGILGNLTVKSANLLLGLLKSAVSNCLYKNKQCNLNSLYIKEIKVTKGITMKRMRPRAMGRGFLIRKKTSNVTIILSENN